jgi:hypothetical protein
MRKNDTLGENQGKGRQFFGLSGEFLAQGDKRRFPLPAHNITLQGFLAETIGPTAADNLLGREFDDGRPG